ATAEESKRIMVAGRFGRGPGGRGGPPLGFRGRGPAKLFAGALSPDGVWGVSGGGPGTTADVWNLATGRKLGTLSGHEKLVMAAVFTPDGKKVGTASHDATLKLWNPMTCKLIRTMTGHSAGVTCVAITRDGTRAISGDHQGVLRLWDLKSGACIGQRSTNSRQIWSVAVSPDGKQAL